MEEAFVFDTDSVKEYLTSFKNDHSIKDLGVDDLRQTSGKIGGILNAILRPPNNLQMAIT